MKKIDPSKTYPNWQKLLHINTEELYRSILGRVGYLFDHQPEEGTETYREFTTLCDLVVDYEALHYPIPEATEPYEE